MKSSKKGFTLVEILVVIVLISLILGLGIPGIMKLSENSKKRTYKQKVSLIESAGVAWGNNNKTLLKSTTCDIDGIEYDCYKVSVERLIEDDYLNSEKNGEIAYSDPTDNTKSLIDNCVFIYKKNNRVYSKFSEKPCEIGETNTPVPIPPKPEISDTTDELYVVLEKNTVEENTIEWPSTEKVFNRYNSAMFMGNVPDNVNFFSPINYAISKIYSGDSEFSDSENFFELKYREYGVSLRDKSNNIVLDYTGNEDKWEIIGPELNDDEKTYEVTYRYKDNSFEGKNIIYDTNDKTKDYIKRTLFIEDTSSPFFVQKYYNNEYLEYNEESNTLKIGKGADGKYTLTGIDNDIFIFDNMNLKIAGQPSNIINLGNENLVDIQSEKLQDDGTTRVVFDLKTTDLSGNSHTKEVDFIYEGCVSKDDIDINYTGDFTYDLRNGFDKEISVDVKVYGKTFDAITTTYDYTPGGSQIKVVVGLPGPGVCGNFKEYTQSIEVTDESLCGSGNGCDYSCIGQAMINDNGGSYILDYNKVNIYFDMFKSCGYNVSENKSNGKITITGNDMNESFDIEY